MQLNNDFIPSYIIDIISNSDCMLEISSKWDINRSDSGFWFYNEAFGSKFFEEGTSEEKIISLLLRHSTTLKKIREVIRYGCASALVKLWQFEIIKLEMETPPLEADERYKWMLEYFSKYACRNISPIQMLDNLKNAKVCIIGLGGLGSTLALSLSASGIGALRLVDGDVVESSNLPRQIVYGEKSIGNKKTEELKKVILNNNSRTKIELVSRYIDGEQAALKAVDECNFVVLCADAPRFKIRAWIGKACFHKNIPQLAMAGSWVGPIQVPNLSPCFACIGRYYGALSPDINGLVESLRSRENSPRASYGPRPLILSGFISALVLNYISGIDRESTLNRRFSFDIYGNHKEDNLVRYRGCVICGQTKQP